MRLSEEYYLKYLSDDNLTSIEEVAKTPLWSAYMARNTPERQEGFMQQNVADFLAVMKRSGEHLQSFRHMTALGMTDEQLTGLEGSATLILHHGNETDELHPIPNSRAATTLLRNSTFEIAPSLQRLLDFLLPFVKKYTPLLGVAPSSR